jgi:predicted aspartyl protease
MPRPLVELDFRPLGPVLLISVVLGFATGEAKTITEFLQERGYEPVKLQRLHANHLLASAHIGPSNVRCLIDTGASLTAVDKRLAASWPKVERLEGALRDIFGKDVSGREVVLMRNLEIGRCAFPDQPVAALELRPDFREDQPRTGTLIPRKYERLDFEIILGLDFLRRHHGLIDCHAATLYIRPDAAPEALAATIEESFRRSGYSIIALKRNGLSHLGVDGSIGGRPVQMLIDTGAWVTTLDRTEAKTLGLKVKDLSAEAVGASGARADLDMVTLGTLKIGNYDVPPVRVGVVNLPRGSGDTKTPDGVKWVGLLGPEVLAFNGALIDCHAAKMYLKPMEQPLGKKK